MSVNETEEVVGADNRVAFSIEGIALLHVGILGKDFKIFGQEGIILPDPLWNMGQKVCAHTAGSNTIFVQIYMDPPPGVPGVSKNHNFFFTNKTVEFLR